MKNYYFYLAAIAALASCSSDDFLGTQSPDLQTGNGEIQFVGAKPNMTRAGQQVGATAAATLGGNFIVEGVKGADNAAFKAMTPVFDNYLVVWGENTAGKTDDNTNDWRYVGVTESDCTTAPANLLSSLGRTVDIQSIKYWDYSQAAYMFMAYSTGTATMSASDPASAGTVGVTKIDYSKSDGSSSGSAYQFKVKSSADLAKCYYTEATPVLHSQFGQPVTLTFKNLGAKVRVALYETIPGYAVKSVKFYKVDGAAQPTDLNSGTQDGATLIGNNNATFPEDATVKVIYPATYAATNGTDPDNWNKADVTVTSTPDATNDPKYKEFGNLNYVLSTENGSKLGTADADKLYIGTTLSTATYAGVAADAYYEQVIPTNGVNGALTLRVDYTLKSIDGSGEEINVYGAEAVVPAQYTGWKSNYAYTYIFKISDNTNGWTSTDPTNDPAGLYPITFDAVVEAVEEASNDQTTVTTVATPSVTTYQYGHDKGTEYTVGTGNAANIWIQVMNNSTAEATLINDLSDSKCTLYTITDANATEADVITALNLQDPEATTDAQSTAAGSVVGRNGLTLTKVAASTLQYANSETAIPFMDGISKNPGDKSAAYFASATGNYVFVYTFATSTQSKTIYTYDETVSSSEPSNWGDIDTQYAKRNSNNTYTAVADGEAWTAGTQYYRMYTLNNAQYAVKVIKVVD